MQRGRVGHDHQFGDSQSLEVLRRAPRCEQALIDAARQPSFVAVGQFDDYFKEHPAEADDLRGIQAPLNDYKDRCGLQVAPTDALAVLAEV